MVRKSKQLSRKRKTEMPEQEEKQNELILEEVLSISGKNVEKDDGSPPARMKRSVSKSNEMTTTESKKLNTKKRSVSPPLSSPSKQKKSTNKEDRTVVDEVKASTSERGDPVPNLPEGWRKELVVRKSGKSAGQIDIYFYSPDGLKLRSRPDVASYLKKHKSAIKIEAFDFSRAAKTTGAIVKKKTEISAMPKKKNKSVLEEKSKVGEESKDLSKSLSPSTVSKSQKLSADVPPPDTEEELDVDKKPKAFPEERKIENNGKQEEKKNLNGNSTSRKRKTQLLEDVKPNEVLSSKIADGASSTRMKRSTNKSNEMCSPKPKKFNIKKKTSDDEEPHTNGDVKTSERGDPDPNLPEGWRKHIVVRKSGERAGKIDIYFYSPDGIKLRSRPDVASYLKKHKCDIKLEQFDFNRAAKTTEDVVKKTAGAQNTTVLKKKNKNVHEEKSKAGVESKDSSENINKTMPRSPKISAKVPPPPPDTAEKEDTDGKTNRVLVQILPPKPKKLRK